MISLLLLVSGTALLLSGLVGIGLSLANMWRFGPVVGSFVSIALISIGIGLLAGSGL